MLLATPYAFASAASAYAATDMAIFDMAYSALVSLNEGMISPCSRANRLWFKGGESVTMCGFLPAAPDVRKWGRAYRDASHVPRALIPFTRSYVFGLASSVAPRLIADAWVSRSAYIVHQDVQRAKVASGTFHSIFDSLLITHIHLDGKRFRTGVVLRRQRMHVVHDGMDRARQRLVWLGAFRGNDYIRTTQRQCLGNFRTDPARGARPGLVQPRTPKPSSPQAASSSMDSAEGCSTMAVCQFYLQGRCKFGSKCHNQHPPRTGGGFGQPSAFVGAPASSFATTPNKAPEPEIALTQEGIASDLGAHGRPMWKRTSYAPARCDPNLIGGLDMSPEEDRVLAYQAKQTGQEPAYVRCATNTR